MEKRKCPGCGKDWYSAASREKVWKCSNCGADVRRTEEEENETIKANT